MHIRIEIEILKLLYKFRLLQYMGDVQFRENDCLYPSRKIINNR